MPQDSTQEMAVFTESAEKVVLNMDHLNMLVMIAEGVPSDFFKDLVDTFDREWVDSYLKLQAACEVKDSQLTRKVIHYLSGSGANLGLKRFHSICASIENALDDGVFGAYGALPVCLLEEYKLSMQELRSFIAGL